MSVRTCAYIKHNNYVYQHFYSCRTVVLGQTMLGSSLMLLWTARPAQCRVSAVVSTYLLNDAQMKIALALTMLFCNAVSYLHMVKKTSHV